MQPTRLAELIKSHVAYGVIPVLSDKVRLSSLAPDQTLNVNKAGRMLNLKEGGREGGGGSRGETRIAEKSTNMSGLFGLKWRM
jgi:hypothetical protein